MRAPVVSVLVPPASLIELAAAKAHLRVDFDDDDQLIEDSLATAVGSLDAPTGWLGRALGQQTLLMTAGHFPGCWTGDGFEYDWSFGREPDGWCNPFEIILPWPPVQSVASVAYLDENQVPQTLDPSTYLLADRRLLPALNASWPTTAWRPDAVRVTYVAGYAPGTLPAPIRSAILLKLAALYQNRADGAAIANGVGDGLLATLRVFE